MWVYLPMFVLHLYSKILDEINEAVSESSHLKESVTDELVRLKFEFRQKLSECIDEFAFKILSNIERDMR